jgi:hypothetical protein
MSAFYALYHAVGGRSAVSEVRIGAVEPNVDLSRQP